MRLVFPGWVAKLDGFGVRRSSMFISSWVSGWL